MTHFSSWLNTHAHTHTHTIIYYQNENQCQEYFVVAYLVRISFLFFALKIKWIIDKNKWDDKMVRFSLSLFATLISISLSRVLCFILCAIIMHCLLFCQHAYIVHHFHRFCHMFCVFLCVCFVLTESHTNIPKKCTHKHE